MIVDLQNADVENARALALFFMQDVNDMIEGGETTDDILVALSQVMSLTMDIRNAAQAMLN